MVTQPDSVPLTADPAAPSGLREADLIMKGGVTSGVLYPAAVDMLRRTFRFRQIGGTSAGAIAAAATAAAEYGRDTGGFDRLKMYSNQLTQEGFLLNLFQPQSETRPLFDTALTLVQQRKPLDKKTEFGAWLNRARKAVVRHNRPTVVVAGLIGFVVIAALLVALTWLAGSSPADIARDVADGSFGALVFVVVGLALAAILGYLFGIGVAVWNLAGIIRSTLPGRTFYGMCIGRTTERGEHQQDALTDWMTKALDDIAGLDAIADRQAGMPLTFGDLDKQKVTFKLVTTSLTYGQPFVLPFEVGRDTDGELLAHTILLFKIKDLEQFFPDYVVKHMEQATNRNTGYTLDPSLDGYAFMPCPENLPVVVATRMSLSFPVLLSAVPLYSILPAAYGKSILSEGDLKINWFSDGGISSNFPIHFFDSWLPERPTFGITLTSKGSPDMAGKTVHLPDPNERIIPPWQSIEGLLGFSNSIWKAAQNFRDNMQSVLPGYRERIVKIGLEEHQGGLNLAMNRQTIEEMIKTGALAGSELTNMRLDVHKWLRFRTITAELERQIRTMQIKYKRGKYHELIQGRKGDGSAGFPAPPFDDTWCDSATIRTEALLEAWHDISQDVFTTGAPEPSPILRATPRE